RHGRGERGQPGHPEPDHRRQRHGLLLASAGGSVLEGGRSAERRPDLPLPGRLGSRLRLGGLARPSAGRVLRRLQGPVGDAGSAVLLRGSAAPAASAPPPSAPAPSPAPPSPPPSAARL